MGALEGEVLQVLWGAEEPLTPGQVLEALDGDLAYTTVMTILTRLWQKGLAERVKAGRAYAYTATVTEPDLLAGRMRDELDRSRDRLATMSRFVDGLDEDEAHLLRALLEAEER
jgi:predicted transcriptional regulator